MEQVNTVHGILYSPKVILPSKMDHRVFFDKEFHLSPKMDREGMVIAPTPEIETAGKCPNAAVKI